MAVRLTADGEVDKRTKEYKDSQKKKFRWWKIPFLPFYALYKVFYYLFYLFYLIFFKFPLWLFRKNKEVQQLQKNI
ncbi:MAG: hypothetical protein D8H93_31570 [Capnocytophaga sp.]|nr:MAG: hypothetical protein D8H93_31570 [Capnocytophaga sp.]